MIFTLASPTILMFDPMLPEIEAELDQKYHVLRRYQEADHAEIERLLGDIVGVTTGGGTGISRDWLLKLPSLRVVAVNGVGTDKVDLATARERGVEVKTTAGVLTADVADMGLALMLAVLRRLRDGDALVRSGGWADGKKLALGTSLKGKTLGILGLGQIGKALAKRAHASEMNIAYCSRSETSSDPAWQRASTPAELAATSDVLAVCLNYTPETRSIVNSEVLERLGPTGVLINIARGGVVDEKALIRALKDGTIAGAGLDVFENEPRVDTEFNTLPNVFLMPHQASATLEARQAMGHLVLQNLANHIVRD
ncbi:2-hydroxyacid dehydrogenase [Devosia sp. 2618]|uniref:2-hydroxyacid dehydrogenase n=1 Tax=Devosia sp. 2618 TaxID=3156454 RepID=UPI0033957F0C